jgi:hypothetical protein
MMRIALFFLCGVMVWGMPGWAGDKAEADPRRWEGEGRLEGMGRSAVVDGLFLPDGRLLLAVQASEACPGATVLKVEPDPASTYGYATLLRLDVKSGGVEKAVVFPRGVFRITSVVVSGEQVVAAGYATAAFKGWAAEHQGVVREPETRQHGLECFTPAEHYSHPQYDKALDQRGGPFVVRMSADLSRVTGATYLEGWESRWHVPAPLGEDWTQRVLLGVYADGDLAVVHDGGYNRIPEQGPAGYEHFYHAPDHFSRLSPDLRQRRWRRDIAMNPVDPVKAGEILRRKVSGHAMTPWTPKEAEGPWPWPALGNPHTLDLAVGPEDVAVLAGFSSSRTSEEPWWAPYVLRYSGSGEETGRAYAVDPMSGEDNRLNNQVSDSGFAAVAVGRDGSVYAAGIGDGGNSVLLGDPASPLVRSPKIRASLWGFRGRTLFWGGIHALEKDLSLRTGMTFANHVKARYQAVWADSLAVVGDDMVVAGGRHTEGFKPSSHAWNRYAGPGAFVEVFDRGLQSRFRSALKGVRIERVRAAEGKVLVVGSVRGPAPLGGMVPEGEVVPEHPAGYWLVFAPEQISTNEKAD